MKKSILVLCLLLAASAQAQIKLDLGKMSALKKIQYAEIAINNLYVDSVSEEKLAESAIRGMLESLDPHSTYTDAKETQSMNEPLQGDFEGIGVQFNMVEDTLVVVQPTVNGPSEKVGIQAGDRIVMVNDTVIAGVKMERSEIMQRLRGKKGTVVHLGIVRRGANGMLWFDVKRDKIPVHTLDAAYMVDASTGYIRLEGFGEKTYDEFMEAVKKLQKQGMQNLVLDLQSNGGGYLQAAVLIASEFLHNGDLVVYTEGRTESRRTYKARGNGQLMNGKVVVLINEYTASAAEIVSGAIQDHDRGVVVGRRSFGKGLVQRPIPLPDGSLIRLTIAHYYTPSGRCIQKPYEKGHKDDYSLDIENRLKRGELTHRDSIHFDDSLKCYTLREHRAVYGGGGIMPDEFVPLDTTQYTRFHRQLATKNIIVPLNLKYIDAHRKQLKRHYPTFSKFNEQFAVPAELMDSVLAEGKRQGVDPKDDEELQTTLPTLRQQLKALIARDLWDMNEYYQVWNPQNAIYRRGIEVATE